MQFFRCHTCFPAMTSIGQRLLVCQPAELAVAVNREADEDEGEQARPATKNSRV